MIEIIREESLEHTEKRELPKDIKQIGKPDIGDRIYVENQVYLFLHAYEDMQEKTAYVLLGKFENISGKQCIFIEAAMRLREITFEGDMPLWGDQTWAYIYQQLKDEFEDMVIVGWAMDIKGQLPNMTARIEALHRNNFGGEHQVLFLMDTLEQEESFYGSRGGHLYQREGFYIYYEKPVLHTSDRQDLGMETKSDAGDWQKNGYGQVFENHTKTPGNSQFQHRGKYRKQVFERRKNRPVPSFASSLFLAMVVCALGIAAYINYQKMSQMEAVIAQINTDKTADVQLEEKRQEELQDAQQQKEGEMENTKETVQEIDDANENMVAVETVQGNAVKIDNTTESTAATETNVETETKLEEQSPQKQEESEQTELQAAESATETEQAGQQPENEKLSAEEDSSGKESDDEGEASAKKYLEQGYYIVQKGDSLVAISRKIYQTTAMLDKLCEVNNIENRDAIYAGQYLTLPH